MTIPFTYKLKHDLYLECEMDYEGGEPEYPDCPGYSSTAWVVSAKLNDVDLVDIMSESVLDQISVEFLEQYENQEDQYEPDYESILESRYHD